MSTLPNDSLLAVRPLHASFVGEVRDLNLAAPLDEATVAAVRAAVARYGVIVLRNQSAMDDDSLCALGARFGPLFNTSQGFTMNRTVIRITNLDDAGNILPADDKFRAANVANAFWHVDNSFSEPPAKYSMLLARIIPSQGGRTEFADARGAYDALDAQMQRTIDGLQTVHSYIYSRSLTGITQWTEEQRRALPDRVRPLVQHDATTGRKALYLASHVKGIIGWEEAKSRALLDELTAFATQPRFVYSHSWEPHDLLMYDNLAVLHRATPYLDMQERRDMRAIRVMVS